MPMDIQGTGAWYAPPANAGGSAGGPVWVEQGSQTPGGYVFSHGGTQAPAVPPPAAPGGGGSGGGGNTVAQNQSNALGLGTYTVQPYPINFGQITGTSGPGPMQAGSPAGNLSSIYNNLNSAVNTLRPQNYSYTAPQMTAASGSGAQMNPALGSAATGAASSYNASQGNAASMTGAQGNAMFGNAATQNGPSQGAATTGSAAQGQASTAQAATISGTGPQGAAATMTPAQMQAAQQGYAGAQSAQISTAGDSAWQAQQAQLANQLGLTANGQGVSPADLQLKAGTDQAIAAQMSMLGSQRGGGNPALAAALAGNGSAAQLANLNQQMGIQRAQETLAAQNSLGSLLGTARGQSQNYNLNQANLNQGMTLADLQNAQAALTNNAQMRTSAASQNANMSQNAAANNQAQRDAMTQSNMSIAQQTALANLANNQQTNIFNAGQGQSMTMADMLAQNNMTQFNAGQMQNMTGLNMSMAQNTGQFNAGQLQNMAQANMNAGNAMTAQNMNSLNAANMQNSSLSQGMSLANIAARNQANQFNAGNAQAMTGQNMNAMNAMTSQNLGNAQASNAANQNSLNQFSMANLQNAQNANQFNAGLSSTANQANQGSALAANQNYYNQLLGLSGAQAGIASSNRAASLAAQQLAVQQNTSMSQIAAQAYQNAGQQNASVTAAIVNAAGAVVGQVVDGVAKYFAGHSQTPGDTTAPLPPPVSGTLGGGNEGTPAGFNPDGSPYYGAGGGQGSTDPQQGLYDANGNYISDENLKTGIEGGNPMLESFLTQYRSETPSQAWSSEFHPGKAAAIDTRAGLAYRPEVDQTSTSGGGTTGGTSLGASIGSKAGGGLGAAGGAAAGAALGTAVFPGVGTVIGGIFGGLLGGAAGSEAGGDVGGSFDSKGHPIPTSTQRKVISPTQYSQWAPVTDDDNLVITSDDREKEAVMSGNQGMQAFLQQANAQQSAQSNQGSTNNAFMNVGQAPSAQVDRQLPPMANPNSGYGNQSGVSPMSFSGGDTSGWGGGASFGGGGMTQGAGQINPGGWSQGGMQNGGIAQAGGMTQSGAGASGGGTFGGGLSSSGSFSGASMSDGGGFSAGGVVQPGGLTSMGSASGGSLNPGGSTMGSSNNGTVTAFGSPPPIPSGGFSTAPALIPNTLGLGPGHNTSAPAANLNMGQPLAPVGGGAGMSMAAKLALARRLAAPGMQSSPPGPATNLDTSQPLTAVGGGSSLLNQRPLAFNMLSDEREKGAVDSNPEAIQQMLDHLKAYSYRYKDPTMPGARPGPQLGVMAQDLEKSPLGDSFVRETPQGKQVDYGKAASTLMAGLAYHNERLSNIERLLGSSNGRS